MPNFKIIQDVADQARVKIYGSQNAALQTDSSGNLAITPASGLGLLVTSPETGLAITAASGLGLLVTSPATGLAITAASGLGLLVTSPATGLAITAASSLGLLVTAPTTGLLITSPGLPVISQLAVTDVSYTVQTNSVTGQPDNTYTVLGLYDWTFGIVNASLDANAQAAVQLQISPSGRANEWINDGAVVTLNQGTAGIVGALVPATLLKYARVFYSSASAASTVTLNIYFQGQTS